MDNIFRFCPNCNDLSHEKDARFCSQCGTPLPQEAFCLCGTKLPIEANYCFSCGRNQNPRTSEKKYIIFSSSSARDDDGLREFLSESTESYFWINGGEIIGIECVGISAGYLHNKIAELLDDPSRLVVLELANKADWGCTSDDKEGDKLMKNWFRRQLG